MKTFTEELVNIYNCGRRACDTQAEDQLKYKREDIDENLRKLLLQAFDALLGKKCPSSNLYNVAENLETAGLITKDTRVSLQKSLTYITIQAIGNGATPGTNQSLKTSNKILRTMAANAEVLSNMQECDITRSRPELAVLFMFLSSVDFRMMSDDKTPINIKIIEHINV